MRGELVDLKFTEHYVRIVKGTGDGSLVGISSVIYTHRSSKSNAP
jgi:hypothetical protein